jgi:hypothetical protein
VAVASHREWHFDVHPNQAANRMKTMPTHLGSYVGIIILSTASITILPSCVSSKKQHEARLQRERDERDRSDQWIKKQQESLQRMRDELTPKDPTPEDEVLTKQRSMAYYSGLITSIRSLDDGVTSADAVARAAVNENIDFMRDWKRAQMANLARPSARAAEMVESAINKLPSQGLLDEATSIVLRYRKNRL